jgi:MoaA/NifB/PqqE/SkfB family radical SAM enzyme
MSKTFCSYPWDHLYVQTSGHIKTCCLSDEHVTKNDGYHQFNLVRDPLLSSWNSEYMKEIREKMLNGERISSCKRCYDLEDKGIQSMRCSENLEFYKSKTVNGITEILPSVVELHFGNVCNLSCKMCSQMFSHTIGKELLKMGESDPDFLKWVKKESGVVNNWTAELDIVYDWFKIDKVKKEVFKSIGENVKNLNIVGGEPTAIKEFYELLEYLYEQDKLKEMHIVITTNLTNSNPNLIKWFKKSRSLTIYGSIDGIGERNEYIRYPTKWSKILQTMDFYADLFKNISKGGFVFGPTFQLLNIDQLTEIITFCENYGIEKKIDYIFNWTSVVTAPRIYDYMIAPKDYKDYVIDKLHKNIKNVQIELHKKQILSHVDNLKKITEVDPYLINSFIRYNDKQDSYRKSKSWRSLLPEMEKSFTKYIQNN